ncbi:MAG: hypothetical protein AAF160_04630 [Pseudomonadota bacterium]
MSGGKAQPTGGFASTGFGNINQTSANAFNGGVMGTGAAFGRAATPMGYNAAPVAPPASYSAAQASGAYGYNSAMTGYNHNQMVGSVPVGPAATAAAPSAIHAGMSAYYSPYSSQVIDPTMAALDQQRQQALAQHGTQAANASAFGGGRHAVAANATAQGAAEIRGLTAANLQRRMYETAAGLSSQDVANTQQNREFNAGQRNSLTALDAQIRGQLAGQRNDGYVQSLLADQSARDAASRFGAGASLEQALFNANAVNRAREFGSTQALQTALRNADARDVASRFNIQTGLGQTAQMGQLADQLFGMGVNGAGLSMDLVGQQNQLGMQDQSLMQALADAARAQFSGYVDQDREDIALLAAALGSTRLPENETEIKTPGFLDVLSSLSTSAGQIADIWKGDEG